MSKEGPGSIGGRLRAGAGSFVARAGLYMLMGALLLGVFWNGAYFPTSKIVFAMLLLVAGGWEVMVVFAYGEWRAFYSPALWLMGAFALLGAASHGWTISTEVTDREAAMAIGLLAAILIPRAQALRVGPEAVTNLLNWLIYTAGFVAVWGIFTYLMRIAPYMSVVDGILRAGSTFEYSNALSCFELMALPLTLALHQEGTRGDRPLYATLAAVQIAAVGMTFSRLGMAALAAILLFFLVTAIRRRLWIEMLLAAIFGLVMSAAALVIGEAEEGLIGVMVMAGLAALSYLVHRFAVTERGSAWLGKSFVVMAVALAAAGGALIALSDRARLILKVRFIEGFALSKLLPHRESTWAAAWKGFREKPVKGWGLGMFTQIYDYLETAQPTRFAHNLVLQTAVDTGIFGALLIAALLLYVALLAALRLIRSASLIQRALAIGSVVFIFYNIFDWEWYLPAITAWFLIAVACIEANVPASVSQENTGEAQTR